MGDFSIMLRAKHKRNDFSHDPFEVIITNLSHISHPLPRGLIDVGDKT